MANHLRFLDQGLVKRLACAYTGDMRDFDKHAAVISGISAATVALSVPLTGGADSPLAVPTAFGLGGLALAATIGGAIYDLAYHAIGCHS